MKPLLLVLAAALALPTPAEAGMVVVGSLVRRAEIAQGGATSGEIVVRNTGDEPLDVIVYSQDYTFDASGQNFFAEPGGVARSNAAWVTFGPHQLRIEPGQDVPVAYRVRVPDEAALDGTYWSVLVVEPMAGRFDAAVTSAPELSVRTVVRYAVHLATDVPGDAPMDLGLAEPALTAVATGQDLAFSVVNRGERGAPARVWADLYGADGVSVGRFEGERVLTYPGCSRRGLVHLPELGPGRYTALVVADGGGDDVFGIQLALDVQ